MRLASIAALSLTLLGGCVIYEKDITHGGHGGGPGQCQNGWGEDSGWGGDTGAAVETTFLLTPNTIGAGETKILSLTADPAFDFGTISDIQLYGGATVCTFTPRATELLVTVSAASNVTAGPEDMLLVLTDGSVIYVADALIVTATGADNSDPNGGTDTNGGSSGVANSGGCGA